MKLFAVLFFSLFIFSSSAFASVRVSNGTMTISMSGGDASYYSGDGSSAGNVNVHLAYKDATKTVVVISGTTVRGGKSEAFSEQIAMKDLKAVQVWATGGNGGNGLSGSTGSSGSSGSSGSDGWSGHDGCPPSSGSDGSDGRDGSDGGNGGNGDDGGNGGRGGAVVVSSAPEENELMLFVKVSVSGGSGGSGGYGGSGGSGGRGGDGGRGGRGGRNTCRDAEGKPTNGPDASDGRDGSRGRDGSNGSSGYSGRDGYGGRSGSKTFNLVSASGTQSFTAPFDLEITGATFVDDNGNSILEPGERVYLSSLQVANKGPMPSPLGQSMGFTFLPSSTLLTPAQLSISLPEIAANSSVTVPVKKGALTLQVPDQSSLIGKKPSLTGVLNINSVKMDFKIETGMAIGWPLSVNAGASRVSGTFEFAKTVTYNLKNVGAQDIGPRAQPLNIAIAWTSKTVPGSDVYVKFADGRSFNLAKALLVADFTIPAKSTAPLSFDLLVRNRKLLSSANGTLTVSARLRDFSSGSDEIIQSVETPVSLDWNMSAIEWNQTVSLAGTKVQCQFPGLEIPTQEIAMIQISKAKGTDKVLVRVGVPGSAPSNLSPEITVSASKLLPYYQQFVETWTAQNAVDFLNKIVSPNTPKVPWSFKSCEVRGSAVVLP